MVAAGQEVTADDVEEAGRRLARIASVTPLQRNARLSALHRRRGLPEAGGPAGRPFLQAPGRLQLHRPGPGARPKASGVVCASAGNHAQGVAWAAQALDLEARIYLPAPTPRQKRDRIAALGGPRVAVIVTGETYDEALAAALADAGRTRRHPRARLRRPSHRRRPGHGGARGRGPARRPLPSWSCSPSAGAAWPPGAPPGWPHAPPRPRVAGAEPAGAASMTAALAAGRPVAAGRARRVRGRGRGAHRGRDHLPDRAARRATGS